MHSGVLALYQHRQLRNLHNAINPSTHIHTLIPLRAMSDQATDPTAADGALATQGQAHDEHAASNAHEEHHATRPKHEDASAAPQHPPSTAASASQPAQPLQRPDAAS